MPHEPVVGWHGFSYAVAPEQAESAFWSVPAQPIQNAPLRYTAAPGLLTVTRHSPVRTELVANEVAGKPHRLPGDPSYLSIMYDSRLPWAVGDAEQGLHPAGLALQVDADPDQWLQPVTRRDGGMHGGVSYGRYFFKGGFAVDCALLPLLGEADQPNGWVWAFLPDVNDGGTLQVGSLALPRGNVQRTEGQEDAAEVITPWGDDGLVLTGPGS